MRTIKMGNTGLTATAPALGCLPLQRRNVEDAVKLIRKAYDGGIRFYDTANAYTDSEYKLGIALEGVRKNCIVATKSTSTDKKGAWEHIRNSLKMLRTDYIDLFQFHCVQKMPDINDPDGAFAAALEAKEQGIIRHIGVTTHLIAVAEQCIESGDFETLQFPFSYISAQKDIDLAAKCEAKGMGFIAMKGLAGGLITNVRACHAFMKQYPSVVPIWGIQTEEELQQWLDMAEEDPDMTDELLSQIAEDKRELGSGFCRGCGYCMPCPVDIPINNAARMNMLLRRSPYQGYMTDEWHEKMNRINNCLECGSCASKCPYQLNTPELLKYMLKDYNEFYELHKNETVD
ncbi:MAG: aldo/keto reductase [Parasporobacterium sp.]|nr:aldo/keto reductase [Parasporobacterium sp.]